MAILNPGERKDDFAIHVDDDCVSESACDINPSSSVSRRTSNQTTIHTQLGNDEKHQHDEETEALIQQAARDIIERIELDKLMKKSHEDVRLDNDAAEGDMLGDDGSYTEEESDTVYGQDTELTYEDGTEMSYEGAERPYAGDKTEEDDCYDGSASERAGNDDDIFSEGREKRSSGGSWQSHGHDENVAQVEEIKDGSSIEKAIEIETDNEEELELQHGEQKANVELGEESDHEDTVLEEPGYFDEPHTSDISQQQRIPSAASNTASSTVSDAYTSTTLHREPLAFEAMTVRSGRNSPHTQRDLHNLSRSTFRPQSQNSLRRTQMSPDPTMFSGGSPMSRKRPTASRLGTPLNSSPLKQRTLRFKPADEPLVLLHVTVLSLKWAHADIIESAPNDVLSKELLAIKESWKLLKEKAGDTVMERGVLIAHPQDSYETLEERLCAALELPSRPRAKILDCGHYLGPEVLLTASESESEVSSCYSSDSEGALAETVRQANAWCDVCEKDVRFGKYDKMMKGQKARSFKAKVYASNGLMGSGAWAAAWRQMEKVDVEIEPAVEPGFIMEISNLFDMAMTTRSPPQEENGFADEESHQTQQQHPETEAVEEPPRQQVPVTPAPTYEQAMHSESSLQEAGYMGAGSSQQLSSPADLPRTPEKSAPNEMDEPLKPLIAAIVESPHKALEDEIRRIEAEQAKLREAYAAAAGFSQSPTRPQLLPEPHQAQQQHDSYPQTHLPHAEANQESRQRESYQEHSRQHSTSSSTHGSKSKRQVDEDSFIDLLLAAVRVLLADKKNIVIGFLGVVVLLLSIQAGGEMKNSGSSMPQRGPEMYGAETAFQKQEAEMRRLQMQAEVPVAKVHLREPVHRHGVVEEPMMVVKPAELVVTHIESRPVNQEAIELPGKDKVSVASALVQRPSTDAKADYDTEIENERVMPIPTPPASIRRQEISA